MRRLLGILVAWGLMGGLSFAQNVRYDAPIPSISSSTALPFLVANIPPNAPILAVCNSPANQVPCTNYASTFDAFGNLCSNGSQDTPQPATSSSCQSAGDAQGNIGFWAPAGTYDYTVCIKNNCFGPYTVTLGGSGGGGSNPCLIANSIQYNNSGSFGCDAILTYNVGAHLLSVGNLTVTGSSFTAFGQTFTGIKGNSGNIQQAGAISGTAISCFDASGNITNVGCPAPIANASGSTTEAQFRNPITGFLNSDSQYTYDSTAHTLTLLNIMLNGTMTWANAFGLNTTIPGSTACVPVAGKSALGISSDGNFAYSNNGDPCGDILRSGGNVISGAPVASQTVTQPVTTSLNVNIENNVRNVTASFNWAQTLAVDWSATGAKTATLTPCPLGIDVTNNANQPYKVYIPTTNAEVVTVTGGTCTSGGTTGTILFTTALAHSASSNQVGSSSAGWQEAINDACGTATGSAASNPHCVIRGLPTGANANAGVIRAPIFVHASDMTLDGNGTMLNCATRDRCMFLGDLTNSNHYGSITVQGFTFESSVNQDGCLITNTQRISNVVTITVGACATILTGDTVSIDFTDNASYKGEHGPVTVSGSSITYAQTGADIPSAATPGVIAIQNAAIEDNSLPGTMDNISYSVAAGGKFTHFFVIDNDQKAVISNFNNQGNPLVCSANFCGSYIFTAGSTAQTPVLFISGLNINPNCNSSGGGNGVTNYANNVTSVTNSVIQGFSMWGGNYSTQLGSFGGTELGVVYNEEGQGPCRHPYNPTNSNLNFGSAGILYSSGNPLYIHGGEQPNGNLPRFSAGGGTLYNYYIIVHDSVLGVSRPLLLGWAAPNGAVTVVVQWPHIPPSAAGATVTYDVLRMQQNGTLGVPNSPYNGACLGGTVGACGSVALAQAQCAGLVCSFSDSSTANTASYVIAATGYYPFLNFWPGGMVIFPGSATNNAGLVSKVNIDTDLGSSNFSDWLSVTDTQPTFIVQQCTGVNSIYDAGSWIQCYAYDQHGASNPGGGALVLANGASNPSGGTGTDLKGMIIFAYPPNIGGSISPQHIITVQDSNSKKTIATTFHRPTNDATDVYIGIDATCLPALCGLSFGSPLQISNYIGNKGDNTSYLERLTASLKTFKVPITTNSNFTFTGSGVLVYPSQARVANLYTGGNPALIYCGTTLTCSVTQLFNGYHVTGFRTMAAASETLASLPFASTTWGCLAQDQTDPTQTALLVELTATTGTLTGTSGHKIWFACDGN